MPPLPARPTRQQAAASWIRALAAIKVLDQQPAPILPDLIAAAAAEFGLQPALLGKHDQLNYRELAASMNGYAAWAVQTGLQPGTVIALLMPNCPAYAAIWLGLTKAGCVVALLNTNLTGDALAHGVTAAAAAHVIAAAALADRIAGIRDKMPPGITCWQHGGAAPTLFPRIDPGTGNNVHLPGRAKTDDVALLIYTSGTTGLPKAAKITHRRLVEWSCWFAGMMDATPADRLYNCLPMYHSIGGVVGIGAMLVQGGSVVIRERFSASRFWADIAETNCTIFQYIGELCRYLVQTTPNPNETEHRLRLCCGNGLAGGVWETFQARFQIPAILEFYASTEGNVSLYNCEGKPGAIGRIPPYLAQRFAIALIQVDDDGAPLRDAAGFCLRAATSQSGEAIGKITVSTDGLARFDGYTDAEASSRKVLTNVFTTGDHWFRTGDLMRKDAAGFYTFIDRLGDTFRWKGENVATTEVESVINQCPGVTAAAVFGVTVPGEEGRAGMAAITVGSNFSHQILRAHLAEHLPPYARPLFIRVCETLPTTGTFKLQKAQLAKEGTTTRTDPVWRYDYQAEIEAVLF